MAFFINSLTFDSLPRLSFDLRVLINKNENKVRSALNRAAYLSGLGRAEVIAEQGQSEEPDFIKKNNPTISEDEIRAWVWYRRSIGIPMKGWEKYYIASSTKQTGKKSTTGFAAGCLIRTTRDTYLLDRDWKPSTILPAGSNCGSWTGREHKSNDNKTYIFCRSTDGIIIVCKDDVTPIASTVKHTDNDITRLVKKGCLFYCDGELLPYPVYVYSNLYDRTLQLRNDKEYIVSTYGQEAFEHHDKVIKNSMPQKLSIFNPVERERPQILVNSKFAWEFTVTSLRDEAGVEIPDGKEYSLTKAFTLWLCNSVRISDMQSNVTPQDIYKYYITNSPMRNKSEDSARERQIKTKIKGECRTEGERLFRLFLHTILKVEDQQRLDVTWNRIYNAFPSVPFDKVPVRYKISPRFKGHDLEIRPAQREGVAFMEITGSGIIAYDVGVGKTITAIIELASAIQNGKCKRPLIVVPKSTYPNWLKEISGEGEGCEGILSGVGIKVNDWGNLSKVSEADLANVPENSITVITYQGFEKIGFNTKTEKELLTELATILHDGGKEQNSRTASAEIQKYFEMLGVGNKNTICDIEKCGFDYITIDEAHNFKNVFYIVREKKDDENNYSRRGYTIGSQSARAIKAFFINNYIQRKFGRNVMLLTATPFTNQPIEIFSMLSHVGINSLMESGYYNLGEFFEQFCEVETEEVVDVAGKVKPADVIRRFNNRILLQRLIYNHINYKTGEEAGVKRPIKVNLPRINALDSNGIMQRLPNEKQVLTYLKMTDEQAQNQKKIVSLISNPDDDKNYVGNTPQDTLRALNFSLNNALHPCLYNNVWPENAKECVERSPKIKYVCECIRSVKEWHEKRGEEVSGQVVYLNRGLLLIPFIKQYLLEEIGFKKNVKHERLNFDEVEVIDGSTGNRKEDIMVAFNAGVVKVIIGTKTICEGVNLQTRSTCLYNLYPDWNPTDLRQLEGRIWRQGNKFNYTRIVLPLVQDSMDVFVFQKIGEKTSRVNEIWAKGTRGNVIDVDSLDPDEIKYALLTDVRALATTIIDKEKSNLELNRTILQDKIKALNDFKEETEAIKRERKSISRRLKEGFDNLYNLNVRFPTTAEKHINYFITKRPIRDDKTTWKDDWHTVKEFDEVAKTVEVIEAIHSNYDNPNLSDQEFVCLIAKGYSLLSLLYVSNYEYNSIKERLKKVSALKKTTFTQFNLDNEEEIECVSNALTTQLTELNTQIAKITSDDYFEDKVREVIMHKQDLAVNGQTPENCLKGFTKLNYLLAYPFDPNNDGHTVPEPNEAPQPTANSSSSSNVDLNLRIRIARVKAKALLLFD